MPARYAPNQRNRNASQRAGRRVGKRESRRLAAHRVRTKGNAQHTTTTAPANRKLYEDGTTAPKASLDDTLSKRRATVKKVLREQTQLERNYFKKTGKVPMLKTREAPGWPDQTPTQRKKRSQASFKKKYGWGVIR
jgi:hypothetical protein